MRSLERISTPRKNVMKDAAKIEREMQQEEKVQQKFHNIEHKQLSHMVYPNGAKGKAPPRKKVYRPKVQKAPTVDFAPHGGRPVVTPSPTPVVCGIRDLNQADSANDLGNRPQSVDVGAFRVQTLKTGYAWTDAVYNGVTIGESRYPDPFTLVKTTLFQTSNSITVASQALNTTPGANDYGVFGLVKGSGVYTAWKGQFTGAGPTYVMDWKASTEGSWYHAGIATSDFISRPNGVTMDLIPRLVGPAHSIKVFAFPLQPLVAADLTISSPTGWPTNNNSGLSPAQVSWGGREWECDSTSKGIRLVCLPWDSRGFDFNYSQTERYGVASFGFCAWSGWVFWASGMTSSDRFDVVINCVEEAMPRTYGTASQYSTPQSNRRTDTRLRDNLVNHAKDLANAGMAAYSMIDHVVDVAKKMWGVGKTIASGLATAGFFNPPPVPGTIPAFPASYPLVPPVLKPDEEKKEAEFFRHQSQSSSSSSGDGRNLDIPLSGRGMAQVAPTVRKQ